MRTSRIRNSLATQPLPEGVITPCLSLANFLLKIESIFWLVNIGFVSFEDCAVENSLGPMSLYFINTQIVYNEAAVLGFTSPGTEYFLRGTTGFCLLI